MHLFLMYATNAIIAYPLSQANAETIEKDPDIKLPCEGQLPQLWLQAVFAQSFYIVGAIVYLNVIAEIRPYTFHRWTYIIWSIGLMVIMLAFFATRRLSPYTNAMLISSLEVGTYFVNGYNNNLGLAAVDQHMYGFYNGLLGLSLTAAWEVPVLLQKLGSSTNTLIWASLIGTALSLMLSLVFSIRHREALEGIDMDAIDGMSDLGGDAPPEICVDRASGHSNLDGGLDSPCEVGKLPEPEPAGSASPEDR
eukprot:NODE_699_length_1252_cov_107.696000_g660_i0.p1 GENE.NODE_699_length_1252_cov_107.696000_g660_i0~~NODE_699_length_1252_cov_107.696000_g660_i0.p1  ORF type:complete len:251 (-),score=22.99 NODE_699_length_1252_cov_107.696000_g660_i0:54-806(-)